MESERLEKLCIPAPPPGGAPWLVYLHEHGDKKMQTFSTIRPENNKSYLKAIPELQDMYVRSSSFGWLLLQHRLYYLRFSLWNPMTLETISLPLLEDLLDLDNYDGIDTCALTSSPDYDDDFAVFVFCGHFAFSCRPRNNVDHEPTWQVDEIEIEGQRVSVKNAIACNGVIYAWAAIPKRWSLVTVKKANNAADGNCSISFTSLHLDRPKVIDPNCWGYIDYLLESCGQVYDVCLTLSHDLRINSVEVSELDLDLQENNNKWVEVKSLNDRAFFVRDGCCTWCWASTDSHIEGNSVFVPLKLGGVETPLYQYTLHDRSFTVYFPCPNLLPHWRRPFWFIPQGYGYRFHPRSSGKRPLQKPSFDEEVDICILNQNANETVASMELPKQNDTTENVLDCLSVDIIELTSKYLHWFDYLDFRTTCKLLRSILPPGRCQWRRTYDTSVPLFVSLQNNDGLFQVMDPLRNEARSITIPKSPTGAFSIKYCKDGWLILYSGGESFHFLNLFTRVRGDFPPTEHTLYFMSLGFSTCLGSSDCLTVGIHGGTDSVGIWYIRSGDEDWNYTDFDCSGEKEFSPSTCPPLYRNGGFYFLDKKGRVGVFELVGEEETWQVYGRPKTRDTELHSFHLIECDGKMFSVFIGELGKWILVFRFDDLKKTWVRVKSIGNHVFFISRLSSVSAIAKEKGMGNRIYLPNLRDNRFIFYSLETRKYHVVGSHVSMDNFCPSKEPFECCWA